MSGYTHVVSKQLDWAKKTIADDRARAGLGPDFYDLRAARASLPESRLPLPEGVSITQIVANGVTCYWVAAPNADPDRVIAYFHGGGFLVGGFHSHRPLATWLSYHTGAAVLFAEYRLAPEYRYPAGAEDCFAAYRHALEFGPDGRKAAPRFVAVAGDSAGGAMAAGVVLRAKAAGLRLPDAVAILCGMLDLDEETSTFLQLSQRSRDGVRLYVRDLRDLKDPLASPMLADLERFPPLLVQTGTDDYCADDNRRFAARAKAAAVDVTLEDWPEMIHVWQRFVPELPEAVQALQRIGEWLAAVEEKRSPRAAGATAAAGD